MRGKRPDLINRFVAMIAIAIGVFCTLFGCDRGTVAPPPTKTASLVISGDTGPWIVPCGCTANQSGGLLRRATFLKQAGKDADIAYLDVGGAAAGTTSYFREKFTAVLQGEVRMGILAHNLGKAELAFGPESLREISTQTRVPFISANTRDAKSNQPLFPAFTVITLAGRKIAVIGLVSPQFATKDIAVTDAHAAISEFVAQHKEEYDSLIVLAYLPDDELQQLAVSTPEADAIIGGPTGQAQSPRMIGNLLFASATNKGKYLIQLDVPADVRGKADKWSGKVIDLDGSFADDPDQKGNLQAYLSRLDAADYRAVDTGLVSAQTGAPAGYAVAGDASCIKCHAAEKDLTIHTAHAHAGETLSSKGFLSEPYCLQCHSTGFGLPAGFESPKRTPKLLNVGCESCHGPSQAHVEKTSVRTPFDAFDQCVRCHDHENSPLFNRETYWKKISHGAKKEVAK